MTPNSRSYINHFISADTIVPNPSNPQSWNRYSYVSNNPLRYIDPTGHMQYEDDTYRTNKGECKPGDTSCNWVGKSPKKNNNPSKKNKPIRTSTTITTGISLGSPQNVQDYYGDYENNTNVPYFPGGNPQPNPCVGAAVACLTSFFVSIMPPASIPTNPTNNFFLTFILTQEENGITMSDVQWSNQHSGQAIFSDLQVNNRSFAIEEGSYMPYDGVYRPIPGSGMFSTTGEISIQASVYTLIQTSNGPGVWPYKLTYP